jgi:hypothetical protein
MTADRPTNESLKAHASVTHVPAHPDIWQIFIFKVESRVYVGKLTSSIAIEPLWSALV